jgi:SAM-dependent methyltransferase
VQGDFERYLDAKATVDDRALDRRVLGRVRDDLRASPSPTVLEAGTGTGAFLRRFLGFEGLPDCTYVAVDTDADLLATARERVLARARDLGFEASVVDPTVTDPVSGIGPAADAGSDDDAAVDGDGDGDGDGDTDEDDDRTGDAVTVAALRLRGPARVDVRLVAGDALAVAAAGSWDLLVAQAFVDLLTPDQVDRLVSGVVDGGGVYFPITFDGGTTFAPSHPADERIVAAYHATMTDESDTRLGATAGRRLLALLPDLGVDPDAVGGSSWVVAPRAGAYPADESYFLRVIVETVADAVRGAVPSETVDAWLDARRRQRADGSLRFVARNLDLYGRRERAGSEREEESESENGNEAT